MRKLFENIQLQGEMAVGNIISMNDMKKKEILDILELARKIEDCSEEKKLKFLHGKIIATLFFEPSTRTKMSFESAAMRLGANILSLPPVEQSSVQKGESFTDTIKMVESYSDLIVVRHPLDGAAKLASETSKKPVINAGDGSNQHPSQTWYYVFLQQRAYETPVQHTFTVKFDQRGIVTETNLDKPLPEVSQQGENNTIIQTGEKAKSSWWQFWK